MNYSRQREEIIDLLKTNYDHPTAEEIYILLKENGSTSSRSTVYRNLGLLSEHNLIRRISIVDAPDRYDFIRFEHSHIVCTKCKRAYDFEYEFKYDELKESVKKQTNADISDNLTILCVCNNCLIAA